MKRKFLSLILVFAMTVSLLTVGTGAVEPTYGDTAGHWAESSIDRWSGHGIIQGSNGLFDPNGQLTCAQLATILAKLLKLPAAPSAGFSDVAADAWYADAINRCVAAGILNGNGDGTVSPTAPITRERAMVMLGRALGIQPIENPDLSKYGDAAKVSAYAQGYVAAMIEAGIVTGVGGDQIAPQDNINRASTVTILDRAIVIYADKDGATIDAKDGGLILIVAKDVKIVNAPEGTTIVVADGATGLNVNDKAVTDDQTYVVPKSEPAKPSSGSSSGGSSNSHSHTIDTAWTSDDTYHWHEASCRREAHRSDKAEHTWGEWEVTPATCTTDGSKKHSCTVCEYEATETIPATGHNYVGGVCSVCGAVNPADAEASINGNYYRTLSDALNIYAVSGDTVVLNKDITVGTSIQLPAKNITINFGTYTITGGTDVYVLRADTAGANITLTGTTGGICVAGSDSGIVKIDDDVIATVSITGGTYNVDPSVYVPNGYMTENNNGIYTVRKATWEDYTASSFDVVPEGFSMTTEEIPEIVNVFPAYTKHTITISTAEALLYYGTKFNLEAAKQVEGNIFSNNQADNHGHVVEVKLGADIDLDNIELSAPLNIYAETFDGCNKTISNATITNTASDGEASLFRVHGVDKSTFKNVIIKNITVVGGYDGNFHAGVVFGMTSGTDVSGVKVVDSSVVGGKYTGAIVGYAYGNVDNCVVENTTVNGGYKVGGITGYIFNPNSSVTNNSLTGVTVKADPVISGRTAIIGKIVGNWNTDGNCYDNSFADGVTNASNDIGQVETGKTVNTSAANS